MKYLVTITNIKTKADATFIFTSQKITDRFIRNVEKSAYDSGNKHVMYRPKGKGQLIHFVIFTSTHDLERVVVSTIPV